MILQANQDLEGLLVKMLAGQAGLRAGKLHAKLLATGDRYSIQAVYKELGKLERQGVVVKERQEYSLRVPWVLEFIEMAEAATKTYLTAGTASIKLPGAGERLIWHFNDLLKLNNFWSQVLLILIQQQSDRTLLTWMPHPWFHLLYSEQEQQYLKALELTDTKLYLINGGRTFLDHWTEKYWQGGAIVYSFAESPFAGEDPSLYYNVIGDYVITGRLDQATTRDIEDLYGATSSAEQVDFSEVFRVFGKRVKASLWVERKPEKALAIRKKFEKYFGIRIFLQTTPPEPAGYSATLAG